MLHKGPECTAVNATPNIKNIMACRKMKLQAIEPFRPAAIGPPSVLEILYKLKSKYETS